MTKNIIIVAGGNGAGKSTFIETYLTPTGIHFLCADNIARDHALPDTKEGAMKASLEAQEKFEELLLTGASFCYETVFSHNSKLDLIGKAKKAGYTVSLVYIHLIDTELNVARVRQRVKAGGHNVPAEKIKSRPSRTLSLVTQAINLVDRRIWVDPSFVEAEPL